MRLEPLEDRSLLSAAGAIATVIHDDAGNFYSVDIRDGMATEWLGAVDSSTLLLDVAFSPDGNTLYGVGGLPATLYEIELDLTSPADDIATHSIGEVRVSPDEDLLLNSLEFGPDGDLYAAGWNDWTGESWVYRVDPTTGAATEVIATDGFDAAGGYSSAGDLTFAEDGSMYVTTMLPTLGTPQLLRIDPAMTTVEEVGTLEDDGFFQDGLFGLTYGPGPEMYAFSALREVFFVNRADAELTFLADLTDTVGGNFVQGAATLYHPPVDLGELDFAGLDDQEPVAGELWYTFEPVRDGYLSAVVVGAAPGGDVDLTLYTLNADGTPHERQSGTGRLDYEFADAGQQYFLQIEGLDDAADVLIANLLQINTNVATVHGTEGDDVFTFSRGTYYDFSINGVDYQFGFSGNVDMTFDGGLGADTAVLDGQATRDEDVVMDLGAQTAEVTGYGYVLHVAGAENISFQAGGGEDTFQLTGTSAADDVTLSPTSAELRRRGTSMVLTVTEIMPSEYNTSIVPPGSLPLVPLTIETRGGGDTLTIQGWDDANEKDQLWAYPNLADYSPLGNIVYEVGEFDTLEAYANAGTSDTVFFFDSDGVDDFYADPAMASLGGPGFENAAYGFTNALGYSSNAGRDRAELHGSPDDDEFLYYKGMAKLYSTTPGGFFLRAKGFEVVSADANAGADSEDVAFMLDSKLSDRFTGKRGEATMEWNIDLPADQRTTATATNFRYVHGYSRYGGNDVADLHDSEADDGVHAKPDQTSIYEQVGKELAYLVRAKTFGEVNVYADAGGFDTATMNDSAGVDIFSGESGLSVMTNPAGSYRNQLYSFERVEAISRGNAGDAATLYDTDSEILGDVLAAEFPKSDPMHYAEITLATGDVVKIRDFDSAVAEARNPGVDEGAIFAETEDWLDAEGWDL